MLYFKSCPKCRTGTVEHTSDLYSEYLQCLMCGFMHDIPEEGNVITELKMLHMKAREVEARSSAVA